MNPTTAKGRKRPKWTVTTSTYGSTFFVENEEKLIAASFNSTYLAGARSRAERTCQELNQLQPAAKEGAQQMKRKAEHPLSLRAGTSTCPVCNRTWTVRPLDDCLLPACGCFGSDTSESNPNRPCQDCGLNHWQNCSKRL